MLTFSIGNVVISTSINITKPFPADVSVSLLILSKNTLSYLSFSFQAKVSMETKIFGIWVSVPCEHNVGSCSYSVCTNKTSIYPDIFGDYNVEKKCSSVTPAIYSVSNLIDTITKSIPSIAQGEFRMDINFDSSYAGHIGCLHVDANLKL